jgi:hypothetical protein
MQIVVQRKSTNAENTIHRILSVSIIPLFEETICHFTGSRQIYRSQTRVTIDIFFVAQNSIELQLIFRCQ